MIEFQHVSKVYSGQAKALDDVNLVVNEGELVVLIGPSGCGKTTALKMVNRLVEPSEGRVLLGGQDIAQMDPVQLRRGIGYVIQQIGLFPHMTIADNVALVPRLKGVPQARRAAIVDTLLDLVGLDPKTFRGRYPRQLSGGQQQRVGVARALAGEPEIVLMDEPFGAVDPISRRQLQEEMRKIQASVRKTILFVTHDIGEAFLLGDRIGIMQAGHLLQLATPEELLRRPADEFVGSFVSGEGSWRKLDYLRVRDVMREPPPVACPDWTCAQALATMEAQGCEQLLVAAEDGRLLGQVSRQSLSRPGEAGALSELLVEAPQLREAALVKESLPAMAETRAALLAVVDEAGRLTGSVTYDTLLALFAELAS